MKSHNIWFVRLCAKAGAGRQGRRWTALSLGWPVARKRNWMS